MLTERFLDSSPDPLVDLTDQFQTSVIKDIARRLAGMKYESAAWQVQRLNESGMVYNNILDELSKITGQSETTLRQIFQTAGVESIKYDDRIYEAAGLRPRPLNLSPAMREVLSAGLQKTNNILKNLTATTAINGEQAFIDAADLAYMQVSTGAMSYDQAIRDAVKSISDGGLWVKYPSGHRDRLDVATRRAVLTGVGQTTGNLQISRADEMGCDLVQTSAHIGARPTHQEWQGRVFSRSGSSRDYPSFVESTGYGTGPGLMGWNCRHTFFPFFAGLSVNPYSEEELTGYENKTVKYNGQDIPIYDATQIQRGIERKIRSYKRQAAALEAIKFDNSEELGLVKQWQGKMRDFIAQTGLQRQSVREQIIVGGKGYVGKKVTRVPLQPSGNGAPVSKALRVKGGEQSKAIRNTISLIDSVHGDGSLPEIPIQMDSAKTRYGVFKGSSLGPIKISISKLGDHQYLTTAHEIGHFLDFSAIGEKNILSSKYDSIFDDWKEAVKNSDAYKKWQIIRTTGKVKIGVEDSVIANNKYVKYSLQIHEIWARSYAQYIAEKSGNDIMMKELNDLLNNPYPVQWGHDDFVPVRKSIDKLFRSLGWIK